MKSNLAIISADVFALSAEIEYIIGLIGRTELEERMDVLLWLMSDDSIDIADPRIESESPKAKCESKGSVGESGSDHMSQVNVVNEGVNDSVPEPFIEFLPLGIGNKWFFTIGDRDNYPSVSHGHLNSKNQPWPKLNPYLGRAFQAKHSENLALRLSRSEMIYLWNDKDFQTHALKQIAWYRAEFPYHLFPVPLERINLLPRWRYRK